MCIDTFNCMRRTWVLSEFSCAACCEAIRYQEWRGNCCAFCVHCINRCVFWGKCSSSLWVKWHLVFPLQLWKTNTWFWSTTSISLHVRACTHTRTHTRTRTHKWTHCLSTETNSERHVYDILSCFITRELSFSVFHSSIHLQWHFLFNPICSQHVCKNTKTCTKWK